MKTGDIVLTLDEAIKHCKENVQKETQNGNLQCAIEHNQSAQDYGTGNQRCIYPNRQENKKD